MPYRDRGRHPGARTSCQAPRVPPAPSRGPCPAHGGGNGVGRGAGVTGVVTAAHRRLWQGDLNRGGAARARTNARPRGATNEPQVPPTRRCGACRGRGPSPIPPSSTHRGLQHHRGAASLYNAPSQRDLHPNQAGQVTRVHAAGGAGSVRHRRHGAGAGEGRGRGRFVVVLHTVFWGPLSGGVVGLLAHARCARNTHGRQQRAASRPASPASA